MTMPADIKTFSAGLKQVRRNIFLGLWTATTLATPIISAQGLTQPAPNTGATRPVFDVASIKPSSPEVTSSLIEASAPGDIRYIGFTVKDLLLNAYGLLPFQLIGGPDWINSDRYDVSAKIIDVSTDEAITKYIRDDPRHSRNSAARQLSKIRLQSLLEDRFQLKVHAGAREVPIYALVIAKNGPKFHSQPQSSLRIQPGLIQGTGVPIVALIDNLRYALDHILVDKTGLKDYYDITLKWSPDDVPPEEATEPPLRTALQEQLGLKIEQQKGPASVMIVDKIERPTAN
jgi:uncharacterized protein (TIGR03435 family)